MILGSAVIHRLIFLRLGLPFRLVSQSAIFHFPQLCEWVFLASMLHTTCAVLLDRDSAANGGWEPKIDAR
jgi:hypothetical protein